MEENKIYKLEELSKDRGSYGIAASAVPFSNHKYTYLRITDINDDGTLKKDNLMSVDEKNASDFLLEKNDIVFARTGNSTGRSYFYDGSDGELVFAGFLIKFSIDENKVNPRILKYYTHSTVYYSWIRSFDTGGTRGNINAKTYGEMPIMLPSRKKQDRIVDILKSFDDKIELNNRINANLEEQAQALFRRWFVDFEFPNEQGLPYKSNGGTFVDSELGKIPDGWKVGNLFSVATLFDSKRKPLSNIQRASRKGEYPYYGATSVMDYVDDYLFDGTFLLMGEDGSVVNEQGYPFLQYVTGKFWVNNHAHIMQGKNGFSTEMLYCMMKMTNISNLVTGAVQAKLSQTNMNKILFPLATKDILKYFSIMIEPLYALLRKNVYENQTLIQLRDLLLPKLMNGEIKWSINN